MASIGFKWLDILEKEFDNAFVDLDLSIGELESEEPDVVFNVRQKLCTLSSCFAQLTHKAQTIFQNSAKIEAELIHMRAELINTKSKKEVLESELHNLLLQLHSSQLSKLPDNLGNKKLDQHLKPDVNAIKKRLDAEIRHSPIRRISKESDELKFSPSAVEPAQYKVENAQLQAENAALRNEVLMLTSEVYGAKLAAKYLDKELAGRIQQLQLLGKEMRGDVRDKLWRQLESEILLQRHKTVVRACRRNSNTNNNPDKCAKPERETIGEGTEQFGDIRTVVVKRKPDQGLGISITGGREHGVPILISELEPNGPAVLSEQLYIGDAILFVNEIDLRHVCHREAVSILQQQTGDCTLQVQYIAADDSDNSLEEDGFHFRFFDEIVCDTNNLNNPRGTEEIVNTPTAPRTPDFTSASRLSRNSIQNSPQTKKSPQVGKVYVQNLQSDNHIYSLNTDNGNLDKYKSKNEKLNIILDHHVNNNVSPETTTDKLVSNNIHDIDTTDLVLVDNATNNVIKLEDFKKVNMFSNINNNFNTSTNSLNSENLSSPMQTSTDVYLDSDILSTDLASNDSQSPKNLQTEVNAIKNNFDYGNNVEREKSGEYYRKPQLYGSNDSIFNTKSDQSLLNSVDSCDSSPLYKPNRDYKKQKKHKKKHFGVKTLQSIFTKHDGYSDISTTASELGEDQVPENVEVKPTTCNSKSESVENDKVTSYSSNSKYALETSPQFEKNIHTLLSDIFIKNFSPISELNGPNIINKPIGTKKTFSLHGQNLRVGKALRLCPNDDFMDMADNVQRKEKLLARYVYNANSLNADGVGDPDFGTPV